ncbi:MAG: RNA 2',3'-cyclic phosphodiesterase [Rhodoferax sp.]|uniref:RNA 2',3'-cyclic phosphodiesterase n=1 Tax=Rhodoferax sp. TaxID=50421 RepID=UPI00261C415A|nr:RNA 2',3'-cyclic phosphodiesterase [Rhodoferax sp.]MDD2880331.1 RNA 2',3'-cyclic phosphodiesterase [Rhodoferax sp.]
MSLARTQRLFLALWPSDSLRGQLQAHADQWHWPSGCVRYAPDDWHVTLHFLGNVAADQVNAIETSAAVPFEPFALVLDQPALWRHGLAVLCPTVIPKRMSALHGSLGLALQRLDLAVEARPYRPHVTLARQADEATLPPAPMPVQWQVSGFALVLSTGDTAQRYRVLRHYR